MNTKDILLRLDATATMAHPSSEDIAFVHESTGRSLFARFFFARIKDRSWMPVAIEGMQSGCVDEEGVWVRLRFLLRILESEPRDLVDALNQVRCVLARWMSREIVATALKLPPEVAWELRSFVSDGVLDPAETLAPDVGAYLAHVANAPSADVQELLILVEMIVSFAPRPVKAGEPELKTQRDPTPRVEAWSYQQILEAGVRPLTKRFPIGVAKVLADAVADLMEMKNQGRQSVESYDTSRGWCAKVNVPTSAYLDPDEALVHTLTFACEQVFKQSPQVSEQLRSLDTMLRSKRWRLFTRIRHHCYAEFPLASADWIRAEVLDYPDYEAGVYPFEFAAMLKSASSALGDGFLSRDQRTKLFEQIYQAPTLEAFGKVREVKPTAEQLGILQRRFWYRAYWPFEAVLIEPYLKAFRDSAEKASEPLTVENYDPHSQAGIHQIESRSPKSDTELAALTDRQLIEFLNTWKPTGRDPKEWWVEVNSEGLAAAFKRLLAANPARFGKWSDQWKEFRRPILVQYALDAAAAEIKNGELARLKGWLGLAEWVVSLPPVAVSAAEATEGTPDWEPARRAVVEFAFSCVEPKAMVGREWRKPLEYLLQNLCTGYDTRLESGASVMNPSDPLTDAINTTRGRAFEALVQFGFWLREPAKTADEDQALLKAVLAARFAGKPPLAVAEYAQLGRLYPFVLTLAREWTTSHQREFFGEQGSVQWQAAFTTLVQYTEAHQSVFETTKPHYSFAIGYLDNMAGDSRGSREFIPRLGQHLFLYYVWGLTTYEEQLAKYYSATKEDHWKNLFHYAGQLLGNSPKLSAPIRQRCEEFMALRLENGTARELGEISAWLGATAFSAEWRLQRLIRTLDKSRERERVSSLEIKKLVALLEECPGLVVEAFARMTVAGGTKPGYYFEEKDVWPILSAGLASKDAEVRRWGELAQNNLLEAGLFEYLRPVTGK